MSAEKTASAEIKKYSEEWYNEEVTVNLIKDNGKYKEDVIVTCNGTSIKIPRGKPCKVKRKYALILEEAQARQTEADFAIEKLTEGQSK